MVRQIERRNPLKQIHQLEIFNTEIAEERDKLDELIDDMGEAFELISIHTAACRTDQVGILAHFVTVVYKELLP